jgi:hypothetical protein
MPEKSNGKSEERKAKARRRLLKLGLYSIPIITTIVASSDAVKAGCGPANPCAPSAGCNPGSVS